MKLKLHGSSKGRCGMISYVATRTLRKTSPNYHLVLKVQTFTDILGGNKNTKNTCSVGNHELIISIN